MNIVMVVEYFLYGGTEQAAVNLARGLREKGHNVRILTTSKGRHDSGVETIPIRDVNKFARYIGRRPDVVLFHSPGPLSYAVLAYAKARRIPTAGYYHTVPDVFMDMVASASGLSRRRRLASYILNIPKRMVNSYLRSFYNSTDIVLCPSVSLKRSLLSHGFRNVHHLAYGLDFEAARPHGSLHSPVSLLYVGQFRKDKNIEFILRACSLLQKKGFDFVLDLVGFGPEERRIKQEIARRKLEGKMRFYGVVPHEKLSKIYASHDIYVNAAASETFGLSMAEALSHGLPVVAMKSYGTEELINGKNGTVIRTTEQMANAIQRIGKRYPNASRAAVASVHKYKIETFADNFLKFCGVPEA